MPPYAGLVNFRDVGGPTSRHGGAVRTGRVFRAGLFSFVGSDESRHLVGDLGVRAIVDLRTQHEIDLHPPAPIYARHPEITRIHVPFFDGADLAALTLPAGHEPAAWSVRYAAYTDVAGRFAVPSVLEAILAGDASPTVFHCWSGKDRTGLTAAMLLDLLGVDDDDIGADYERSMEWWLARLDRQELAEDEPVEGYHTVAEVILLALGHLRDRHGSIEEMLLRSGMRPDLPERLRNALLH